MINGKHDSIGPHSSDGIQQIRRREVTRCCQPDVLLEVIAKGVLHRQPLMSIVSDHPVIDAPKVARSHLSKMSNDDLDTRKAVKDTISTHSEYMALYVLPKL